VEKGIVTITHQWKVSGVSSSKNLFIIDITELGKKQLEIFYNRQRIQSKLGFLSPAVFSRKYYAGLLAA
jgi:hypothetical protein